MERDFFNLDEIQKYYVKDANAYVFKEEDNFIDVYLHFDLDVEANIEVWNLSSVYDITCLNLKANDVLVNSLKANTIDANNIEAINVETDNIELWNLKADNVIAKDIKAWEISVNSLKVDAIQYNLICDASYVGSNIFERTMN